MYDFSLSKTLNHPGFARPAWSILSALLLLIPLHITSCGSSGTPSSGPVTLGVATPPLCALNWRERLQIVFFPFAPYMVLV